MSPSRAGLFGAAFVPTMRITPLQPLAWSTAAIVAVGVMVGWRDDEVPHTLAALAFGVLAASVVLGLDDEARVLVRPAPCRAVTRLANRLAVLLPAVLASVSFLVVARHLLFSPGTAPPLAGLIALVAVGIALHVWASRRRPDGSADAPAIVVVLWSVSGSIVPDLPLLRVLTEAWHTHAWPVIAVAAALVAVGVSGREA